MGIVLEVTLSQPTIKLVGCINGNTAGKNLAYFGRMSPDSVMKWPLFLCMSSDVWDRYHLTVFHLY